MEARDISALEARRLPTSFAALRAISSIVSSLQVHVFEGEGTEKKRVTGHLQSLVAFSPRRGWTAQKFWAWCVRTYLIHGRAVAVLLRAPGGQIVGIQPLDPRAVSVQLKERDGYPDWQYTYRGAQSGLKEYWQEDVLDFVYELHTDMNTALSPLKELRKSFSLAKSMQTFAEKAFSGMPTLMLKMANSPSTTLGSGPALAAASALDKFIRNKPGAKVLPIPPGMDSEPVGVTSEQLQLVEVQRYAADEAAKGFNLSPAFLGDLSKSSYRSAEAAASHFQKFVLSPILEALEQEVNLKVFGRSQRYMRFDISELLRADSVAQARALSQLRQNGFITSNEGRERLELPALDVAGADDLVLQQNMSPLGELTGAGSEDEDGNQGEEDEQNENSGNVGA